MGAGAGAGGETFRLATLGPHKLIDDCHNEKWDSFRRTGIHEVPDGTA